LLVERFVVRKFLNQPGYLVTESCGNDFVRNFGILNGIMEESGNDDVGICPLCRLGYEQSHLKKVVDVGLLSRTLPPLMNVPPRSYIGGLEHCDPFLHRFPSFIAKHLLVGDAALHRVHYQEGKFALANLLVALLPNDASFCDAKYLYHLLMVQKDELLVPLMQGTANVSLKEQDIASVEITLPPLAEQRRVVGRINELAAQIHEAQTFRRQAAEEANVLWERGASRFIDQAARAYPIRPLSDLVTIRGGGTPSKSDPFYWDGKIPWITPKDMKRRELRDSIDHISERATRESPAKMIESGAVLVVVRGMILAHTFPSAVLRAPATINQDLKALIPNKELLPEFLCALFWASNSQMLELVEKSTHDTRKFETGKLLGTKVVVLPIAEQKRIVAELDALRAEVDAMKRLQSDTAKELNALLPSILDRAFAGEL
jgi:hypothetical protein